MLRISKQKLNPRMKAYILRIWHDETGAPRGHVSDPLTHERVKFRNWNELQQILTGGLTPPPDDITLITVNQEKQDD